MNSFLDVRHLKWGEGSGRELMDADCVIFFGMGLHFTEQQESLLAKLKCPVYTAAATRKETALARMTAEQKGRLEEYLRSGGKENFKKMLDYIRYELDGKRIFASYNNIMTKNACACLAALVRIPAFLVKMNKNANKKRTKRIKPKKLKKFEKKY